MECRSCRGTRLDRIISLGKMPLANSFPAKAPVSERDECRFPLELVFCPACALVQITETIPPEVLFSDYRYFSSTSQTMVDHVQTSARGLIDRLRLSDKSLVVEAASNDGYMLQFFLQAGIPVLGIEPAENVAKVARQRGVNTRTLFFGRTTAATLRDEGRQADLFLANNVLAHVADLNGFVEGIAVILKEKGVAVIEVPHLGSLIQKTEFDTIYHEHLCYFSLHALVRLFQAHRLVIYDVEKISIHGGSIRLFIGHTGDISSSVNELLAEEEKQGLISGTAYTDFSARVDRLKNSLVDLLARIKKEGKRTAAYGAAAKGTVMLNYCGLGKDAVEYVVDKNSDKQGLFMPGTHQPVYAPGRLAADAPDYLLILAWNLQEEIIRDTRDFASGGGKYIVPVPEPKVI